MRVWHDDVRRPPDSSWTWVRTNEEAKVILGKDRPSVSEISLDHDLGLHELEPNASIEKMALKGMSPEGSGYDLVCWMIENECVPPKVTIHSWNSVGAANMAARLNHFGYDCYISPFNPYVESG